MMMKPLLLCLSCLLLVAATPAWADVSRDDAAAIAQRQTGGRVLSVERAERDGQAVWRVKVVTGQGEVKVIFIDVNTGRVG